MVDFESNTRENYEFSSIMDFRIPVKNTRRKINERTISLRLDLTASYGNEENVGTLKTFCTK